MFHTLGVGILTFASLVYICETEMGGSVTVVNTENQTSEVPRNGTWTFLDCFWWGTMTITTVGYDSNPTVSFITQLEKKSSSIVCGFFIILSVYKFLFFVDLTCKGNLCVSCSFS